MDSYLSIAKPVFDDRQFVAGILGELPDRWAKGYARKYRTQADKSRRDANLQLLDLKEQIKQHPIGLNASDEEIQSAAKAKAKRYAERLARIKCPDEFENQYLLISEEISRQGVKAPAEGKDPDYQALCNRFACPIWWRRALRVAVSRHVEHEAIKLGFVGKYQFYVSNETLGRRRAQIKRNQQLLQWIEAQNDQGYVSTLAELSAASVANPEIRHGELMTRIRGIEEEAKRRSMVCEFYTITAPSKYHATSNGRQNPKYKGANPRDAQQYLVKVWARIRAMLHKQGIKPVGFRVAEPHKDACPHWHLMLFIRPDQVKPLREICRAYAMAEDGTEHGASQHRFKAVAIDPNKGSAAGYIAKYIAKNINMAGIDDFDRDGKSATDGLDRSVAWAAVWGIRQFQQIGGERITVWRELRRLRDAQDLPEWVRPLWRAADTGEYATFLREASTRLIEIKRQSGKVRPVYKRIFTPDSAGRFGAAAYKQVSTEKGGFFNRYGEAVAGPVRGLLIDGVELVTRWLTWVFSYKPPSAALGLV